LHRPRILILIGGLAAAVALGPAFGATARAADPTVVVRPGDTLTAISKRVGVPIRRLVELNRIANPNRIYAGQRLRTAVEVSAPEAPPAASAARVHVVTRGASLWAIAKHYGVSVSAIVAANGIADPSRIFAGQRLTIPGAGAPAQATPSAPAMPASMARLVAHRDPVRDIIISEADRWGVPRAFALAVAWQESGWQQGVTSHAGAVGVMQLMPATGEWVAQSILGGRVDIYDTRSNVSAGVRLLKHYRERYGGNRDLVLAAYYQGQAAVDRHGIYAVSRPYIASIRQLERLFGG
jgi:soluble lytic murein transglycosylase-like protein